MHCCNTKKCFFWHLPLPFGSASGILSGFSGWCYCSDREKHKNLQQGPKLTDWKAHSLISWRSPEHVWVNLGEKCVCICVHDPYSQTPPAPSPFLFGIWDGSGGPCVCVCVCSVRETERECVGTYCIEMYWSKREGVGLFSNETAADHMTSLVRPLLFIFPPVSWLSLV